MAWLRNPHALSLLDAAVAVLSPAVRDAELEVPPISGPSLLDRARQAGRLWHLRDDAGGQEAGAASEVPCRLYRVGPCASKEPLQELLAGPSGSVIVGLPLVEPLSYRPRMEDEPQLTANEALDVLARFLDVTQDLLDRFQALNDSRVPDSLIEAFFATLEPALRLKALELCDRSTVLASWAHVGNVEERRRIAANEYTACTTLLALAHDETEEVRSQIAFNPSADLDTTAWLMADPSPWVQEALRMTFEERKHDLDVEGDDELPGEDESLTFLFEMVPAAEEEDCLQEWEEAKLRDYGDRIIRETQHADWIQSDDAWSSHDSEETDEGADEDEDEAWRLSEPQVLGMLGQALGAVVIERMPFQPEQAPAHLQGSVLNTSTD